MSRLSKILAEPPDEFNDPIKWESYGSIHDLVDADVRLLVTQSLREQEEPELIPILKPKVKRTVRTRALAWRKRNRAKILEAKRRRAREQRALARTRAHAKRFKP